MIQPIELWYWPTPNGWKISIALEEMGVPYVIKPVNIGAGEQFAAPFQAISPNGRMPAIVDPEGPDGQPLSIFESGAILQYLGTKSGRFYPTDVRARVEVDQWLFWQVGGLGPMAGQTHHFRQYAPAMVRDQRQIAYGVNRYTNETHRLYGVLNQRLAGDDALMGLMLESHLHEGKQPLVPGKLRHGVSVTDACIGWETTEHLLTTAAERLRQGS